MENVLFVLKKFGQTIAVVHVTQNMFPLNVSNVVKNALVAKGVNETQLWHLRYGHLNINGLKLLTKKNMVVGLPEIGELNLCESCIFGKQSRKSFPVGQSWRATCCLELVHADLCGPMKTELSRLMGVNFLCYLPMIIAV